MRNEAKSIEDLKLYTVKDLAGLWEVSERTVLNYLRSGRLQGVKIGGKWLVTEENLLRYMNGETGKR